MTVKLIGKERSHWAGGVIDSDFYEEPCLLFHNGNKESML